MKKNLRLPFLLICVLALASCHKNGQPLPVSSAGQAPAPPIPAFPYNHVTGMGVAS